MSYENLKDKLEQNLDIRFSIDEDYVLLKLETSISP